MTPTNDKTRPVGEHCEAKNRGEQGGNCRRPAGWGTDHVGFGNCKLHGGSTPNGGKAAEKERAAWLDRLAAEVDPSLDKVASLRDAAKDERTQLAAAKDLLDRGGVRVSDDTPAGVKIVIEWPE